MSNVSTPPGRGGRLKITRCLHLEQILGFSSSQAKASSRLPGRPAWFGRGVWRGGRASQGGTPGATCARGPNAHVRSRRQATGQPRKPSVATRWTEPGRGAGTAAALCAKDGRSAGGRPSRSPSFPCFWGRVTDPAALGGGSGGRGLAAWPREAPGAGQSQPSTVWLQASPAPLWASAERARALERGRQTGSHPRFAWGRVGREQTRCGPSPCFSFTFCRKWVLRCAQGRS